MRMNKNARVDIRREFIDDAMAGDSDPHGFKLTKRFISWLFRHYFVWEMCVNLYDLDWVYNPDDCEDGREPTWDERICTCTWQDPFADGIWRDTQQEVDRFARLNINDFRKAGHLKIRCWIGKHTYEDGADGLHVFLYGRDLHECDMHFLMKKRGTTGRRQFENRRDCQYDN